MKNKYFNWGVIGTGGIAKAFTADIEQLKRAKSELDLLTNYTE